MQINVVGKISLLYPDGCQEKMRKLPEVTIHDLGLDSICKKISTKEDEQNLILYNLSKMCDDQEISKYRMDVFEDILNNEIMRNKLIEILDKINFLRNYGSFKHDYEESASTWDLLHRLEEIKDYIDCVEDIHGCLENANISSKGMLSLKSYVEKIYKDNGFLELKKDIENLRASTSDLKSVTVGINLNNRFEADGIGIISINNKYFTKSNIIGNFCDMISTKDAVKNSTEWKENYKFHPFAATKDTISDTLEQMTKMNVAMAHPIANAGIATVPEGDKTKDMGRYMDRITNHMLAITTKKLRQTLNKYVNVTVSDVTALLPEILYYVRFAEYIEKLKTQGFKFCKAKVMESEDGKKMTAKGIYNFKLAAMSGSLPNEIVPNDLEFAPENRMYILTGANRGGKTTITQAVGLLFVLAQGGIYVPGNSFEFDPVDCIYTHFPADEDKTMDLGRLGEECKRFRDIYTHATCKSLLLLNETFSTTSFEEGFYIAKDSIKAILQKGCRTIYNTHMHKLAYDIAKLNQGESSSKAASLIVKAEEGKRSFKVEIAPPEGMSYARDIAKKYGVTYEMLTEK